MKNSDTLGSEFVPPVFVGKWTVQIVNLLKHRPCRHSELRRQLETASQRMLTRTLRNLEATGLIERRVAQTKPLVVKYSLTKLGRTSRAKKPGLASVARVLGTEPGSGVELRFDPSDEVSLG